MQIIRVPTAQKLARLSIFPARYGGSRVAVEMTISTALQSTTTTEEYASAEEAEAAGKAWAESNRADILLIEGGAS